MAVRLFEEARPCILTLNNNDETLRWKHGSKPATNPSLSFSLASEETLVLSPVKLTGNVLFLRMRSTLADRKLDGIIRRSFEL